MKHASLLLVAVFITSLIVRTASALDLSGTTPGPFWATLIGSTQYVSSAHYTAGAGSPYTFFCGDSAVSLGYTRIAQSDCVVGGLDQPVGGTAYNVATVRRGQSIYVVTRRGVITGQVTNVAFAYGEPVFWHNVSLYGGDSGAPTFDTDGNLVGTHHYTCGTGCGIDVHLGALFGMPPTAETNVVVITDSPGGGNNNGVTAVNADPTPIGKLPYTPLVRDTEMFLR
jgi:hypothetical protein